MHIKQTTPSRPLILALTALVGLSGCGLEPLIARQVGCRTSMDCEHGQRCVVERCVGERPDAGSSRDAGPSCVDPDGDGADRAAGVSLSSSGRLNPFRHACPGGDHYNFTLRQTLRAQLTLISPDDTRLSAQVGPAELSDCDDDEVTCTVSDDQGLLSLTTRDLNGAQRLVVAAGLDAPSPYEFVLRTGTPCFNQADCLVGTARCQRAIAQKRSDPSLYGVCVAPDELDFEPACDQGGPASGDGPEDAPWLAMGLSELNLLSAYSCADDEDWYTVEMDSLQDLELQLATVSVSDDELQPLYMHVALHSGSDGMVRSFVTARMSVGRRSVERLDFGTVQAGVYLLRVVQLNRRDAPVAYSLTAVD